MGVLNAHALPEESRVASSLDNVGSHFENEYPIVEINYIAWFKFESNNVSDNSVRQ
jgi:hypothetical protein